MTIGNGMKILENFGENRLKFEKNSRYSIFYKYIPSDRAIKNPLANLFRFGPKNEVILKFSIKILRFFAQNLYEMLPFS